LNILEKADRVSDYEQRGANFLKIAGVVEIMKMEKSLVG